ncbi:hypothetical protein [Paenibacillus sp. YAF4_2]|uniref:hypothetical protein n=1 Tax=Paenibacillus sp. YAF4_2 TaxID=3233085 RepID=UPI003F9CF729
MSAMLAYYAYDGTNVYFRMRLNTNPRFKNNFRNFAWGVLFDTDNNPSTYEWELVVNGLDNEVQLIANTVKLSNIVTDKLKERMAKGTRTLAIASVTSISPVPSQPMTAPSLAAQPIILSISLFLRKPCFPTRNY